MKISLAVCTFALIIACLVPQPANACGGVSCWLCYVGGPCIAHGTCYPALTELQAQTPGSFLMRMDSLTVTELGGGRAQLTIDGLESTGMFEEDQCITALQLVDGIDSVSAVRIVDGENHRLLRELKLSANDRITSQIATEATRSGAAGPEARWAGFFGTVKGTVPVGRPLTYVIDVKLADGAKVSRVAENLRTQGRLALAGATDGSLNADHTHFEPLDNHVYIELPKSRKPVSTPRTPNN